MAATLRNNFLTLLTARGATLFLAMLNSILLARYLGPRDFGMYNYAFSATTIVFGLADLGLSSHAVRRLRLEPSRRRESFRAFTALVNAASVLLSVAVIAVAWTAVADAVTRWALTLMCLPQLFRAMAVPLRVLLGSDELIPQLGYQEVAIRAATLVLLLATMALGGGVLTMVWVSAIPMAASYLYLRKRYWPGDGERGVPRSELAELLRQAWPFACYAVLYAAYSQIDVVLLEKLQPLTNVGYYGAATRFIYPLLQIPAALMLTAFPRLVTVSGPEKRGEAERLNRKLLRTLGGVGLLLAVVLAAGAPWLIRWLVGEKYTPSVLTLQIMAGYLPLTFVQALWVNRLLAAGRIRTLVGTYAMGLIANVALNLWLIPRYAHNGCAIATVAAEAVVLVFTVVCARGFWRGCPATTAAETDTTPSSPEPD